MRHYMSLISGLLAVALLSLSPVYAADNGFWQNPVIKGGGAIHPLPDSVFQPNPKTTYKAVFSVTKGAKNPKKIDGGLAHVARAVNLFSSVHVPLDHIKFVVVLYGGATPVALDNAHYHKVFGVDNPNLALIKELESKGVRIAVCGQAVAGFKYDYKWINPDVKVALSAISTVIIFENQGYALFPM